MTDIINHDWILTKWSTDVNALVEYEVWITDIVDGPNGHDWVIVQGDGIDELAMPLEHFLKQAVIMDETNNTDAYMKELIA